MGQENGSLEDGMAQWFHPEEGSSTLCNFGAYSDPTVPQDNNVYHNLIVKVQPFVTGKNQPDQKRMPF